MNNGSRSFGISTSGMKKLSIDLLEYSEEFRKIKNSLDTIESKLRTNFSGEAANNYNNLFKSFSNNLTYISKSVKGYSEYCEEIIRKYQRHDTNISFK